MEPSQPSAARAPPPHLGLQVCQQLGGRQLSAPRGVHSALGAALLARCGAALLRQLGNERLLLRHALGAQLGEQGALLSQGGLVPLHLQ